MAECPGCGADVTPEANECPECGARLAEPTASFKPVGIEEEAGSGVAQGADGPVLIVRKGPQPGERFFIDRPRLTIGRDPKSDVFLNDMTVSRTHAVVECEGTGITVRDGGSLNGTYVNGTIVDDAVLQDGDVVQIGTFQMVFVGGPTDCGRS
jgi:FHA domain